MARKLASTKPAAKRKRAAKQPEKRATPENPQFNLSDPAAWDMLGGSSTDSGVRMGKLKALSYAPVWQAVSLISGDGAKLPLELYRSRKKEGHPAREEREDHLTYKLVKYKPNREVAAFVFWRRLWVQMLLWNRAFAYIDRNSEGDVIGIYNLLPDRTAPERLDKIKMVQDGISQDLATRLDGQLVYTTEVDGKVWTLWPSQVLDCPGIAFDAFEACDLVERARHSWALGLAQEKFGSKFFSNGARVSGILELPAAMGKVARDKVEEGFTKTHTGQENWFKTVILRDGAKFHQTSISPNEGQMNESREQQVRDVCRWFNLSPSKLGLSDSVSYNSKTEDNQGYYDNTLSPWLTTITSECWFKLLNEKEQRDHFFEHDTDQLLKLDLLKRFQVYEIGRRIGVYSPNDILAKENEAPRPGGDVYQDVLQGAGPKDAPGKQDEQDGDTQEEKARTLDRVLWELGQRANRKSESKAAFLKWVEEGFPGVQKSATEAMDGDSGLVSEFLKPVFTDFQRISPHLSDDLMRSAVSEVVKKHQKRSVLRWISEHYSQV